MIVYYYMVWKTCLIFINFVKAVAHIFYIMLPLKTETRRNMSDFTYL